MKKVIFCLLVPFILQSCTDELHEIDSVVLSNDHISDISQEINSKDIPQNSFAAFYYYVENNKATVHNAYEEKIDLKDLGKKDFSAYWDGYFEFESGDYEFTINGDKEIKVSIDDVVIFDGSASNSKGGVKVGHSLEGIRRLKVFYNMNSAQKVQKIIEYYKSMRGFEDDQESETPSNTSTNAGGNSDDSAAILLDWRKL